MLLPAVEKQPTFAQLFASQLGSGVGSGLEKRLEYTKQLGLEEAKQKKFANEIALAQKSQNIQNALGSVEKMRSIRSKGNLGRGSSLLGFFGGETARDRGEYEQLGKSLISFASTIPIRNRLEFETLAEKLYDPSITDAESEGVLNSMEKILQDSLSSTEAGITHKEKPSDKPSEGKMKKMKFNPKNPEHQKKAQQLHKKYNDVEKVREALRREFEGLDVN